MRYITILLILMAGCRPGFSNNLVPVNREYVVEIPAMTIHLVPPGSDEIPEGKIGYVYWGGDIYVYGYARPDGLLTFEHWVMGHEVGHLMNWEDDRFADPDGGE